MRLTIALALCTLFVACGKKTEPPPTAPAPAADAASPAPAPGSDTTSSAPAADAAPTAETPRAPSDPDTYLVWWASEGGYQTAWVSADGEGVRVEATRPQLVVFADETLFGVETRYVPFRETSCEDFESGKKGKPGPRKWLPYLATRGLAGKHLDEVRELVSAKSDYSFEEPDADGVYNVVGEHWGRTISLVGGWRDLLMIIECEGAYGCGAHGDQGCGFVRGLLGPDAPAPSIEAVVKHLGAAPQQMLKDWVGEDAGEELVPELDHFTLKAKDGQVLVDYVWVASVPYSGTDGSWSSYTQSRTHTGPPVEGLGLGNLPAVVSKALSKRGVEGHFGWSVVKPDMLEAARKAFEDTSTLPGDKPVDDAPSEDREDATTLMNDGRKLTKDRKYSEAIARFDKALGLDDKLARAWSGRGFAKLGADDVAGAKADFEKALTLEDDKKFQAAVHFNLGEVAEKQGDKEAAKTHYETALKLAPSDAAKKKLDALSSP